nr:hypothetical protein [Streptomyces albus]
MRVPGARSAAVVDWISGLALGAAGEAPGGDHETAACETAELARMVVEYRSLGPLTATGVTTDAAPPADTPAGTDALPAPGGPPATGAPAAPGVAVPAVEDVIATNSDSYHLLRFVTGVLDSTLFLHLWLARDEGNLALARIRLAEIAHRLVL